MALTGRRVSAVLCLCCLGAPTHVDAQTRRGVWLTAAVGGGSAGGSSRELSQGSRTGGRGFTLAGGWALNRRVALGVDLNAWFGSADVEGTRLQMSNVTGTLRYFPSQTGFFVKGGVGLADFGVGRSCGQTGAPLQGFPPLAVTADGREFDLGGCAYHGLGRGLGLVAGVGYDVPLGQIVALTIATNFWHGRPGALDLDGQTLVGDWRQNVIDVMIGVTFQ